MCIHTISWCVNATSVNYTLYINSGIYTAIDTNEFAFAAFNTTSVFNPENARILLSANDTLYVKLINTDTVEHGFAIKGKGIQESIEAGDSITSSATFSENNRSFIYYDPLNYPSFRALGLAGLIHVSAPGTSTFFWNLKDFQADRALDHARTLPIDWDTYYPDYFTVNGRSNPEINNDPFARVIGSVNETIQIVITNTGQSVHSLH